MSKKQRTIMLADCQSFYASVEKAANPEYKYRPVVVAGDPERRSGIVLAACPIAKSFGVTTAERIGEAMAKCPELVIIRPHMQRYIEVSMQITNIYQTYTDLVEPYSIDEQFLDVSASISMYGEPVTIAKSIQDKIMAETGVYSRVGISYCKVVSKMACDNFAKKNGDGIFVLPKEKIAQHLWPLSVNKMFMVGSRMMMHFNQMGIYTIGQLANTDLHKLRSKWGINGEVLWRIANGHDDSPVTPGAHDKQKAIGHQMTLPRDYRNKEEIEVILLELSELVCQRCRTKGYMGWVVSVGCQGADFDRPTGFSRQMKMPDPTNITMEVYNIAKGLFKKHWDGLPVRKVGVTLSELANDDEYQLLLFSNREKVRALEKVTDAIKLKYGDSAIMRAVSGTNAGQAKDRSGKIGGHYK
jgi:DNA polymerase-4